MSPTQATGEARRLHEESEWVEAIRAGDASAFEAMFHQAYSEVAEVLGISPRTVEVQIGRALKALRKGLASHRP